jgi:acyl-coenzyme A thioesterase PaaI-like protein
MTTVTTLPFNAFLGLEAAPEPERLLRLPAGPQYLNHLGTVHASALLALAEATSGEFLLRHLGSAEGLLPVVRRLESKFRKPAQGAVTSTAGVSADAIAQFTQDLAAKGRALLGISVELHDASGQHVLTASVEWFVQKLTPPTDPTGAA